MWAPCVGVAMLAAQCMLYVCFAYLMPKGPWRDEPGYTAHQVLSLPLMIYLSTVGGLAWFHSPKESVAERVLGVDDTGQHIAALMMWVQLLWNIPMCCLVRSLREDRLMLLHHVGMAAVAGVMQLPLYAYYANFFIGFSELSSIPLVFVDLHRTEHRKWKRYIDSNDCFSRSLGICRAAFILGFVVIRVVYFPYVMARDARGVYETRILFDGPLLLYSSVPLAGALFCLLQWYWMCKILVMMHQHCRQPPATPDAVTLV